MTASSGRTEQCKAKPIKGGTVCRYHGGSLPNVKATAQVRLARSSAEKMALKRLRDRMGTRSNTDVLNEMERLAAEVIVFKDVCREAVETIMAMDAWRYEGKAGEQLRAEVAVYERALDRCEKVLATCFRLGMAERRASIDEAEQQLVAMVIRNTLNRLELNEYQQRLAITVVTEELRALQGEIVQGELVD